MFLRVCMLAFGIFKGWWDSGSEIFVYVSGISSGYDPNH